METTTQIKLLRLVLNITETSGAYYLFSIPMAKRCKQQVLSYFRPEIKIQDSVNVADSGGSLGQYYKDLRKRMGEGTHNVVHAHSPHTGLILLLSLGLSIKKWSIGRLFSVHYSYQHMRLRNRWFLFLIFLLFDRVVFCSNASKNSFPALFRYLVKGKSRVIYNGIDSAYFEAKIKNNYQPKSQKQIFNIVCIGRLEKIKRFDKIITAVNVISDKTVHLTLIGDGIERSSLKQLAADSNTHNILFTGEIPREEVYEHLNNSDLFISASTTEGHPVSVIESLAAGCPVLLSDIEPHREIMANSNSIRIFNPENIQNLVDEILRFRSLSATERQEIAEVSRNLAIKEYSLANMTNKYINEYESII